MSNWFKSWLGPLSLILVAMLCGIWWMFIFYEVKTVELKVSRKNLPDTTFLIVPSHTKYFVDQGDTTYIFYDKDENAVLEYSQKDNDTWELMFIPN